MTPRLETDDLDWRTPRLRGLDETDEWQERTQEEASPGITIDVVIDEGEGTVRTLAESWLGAECCGQRLRDDSDDFCDICGAENLRYVLADCTTQINADSQIRMPDPAAFAEQASASCDRALEELEADVELGASSDLDRVRAYLNGETDHIGVLFAHSERIGWGGPAGEPMGTWRHGLAISVGWPEHDEDEEPDTAASDLSFGDPVTITAISCVATWDPEHPDVFRSVRVHEPEEDELRTVWSQRLSDLCE